MNPDQDNNDPGAGRGRGKRPLRRRPLRHRVVRSRYLVGMPKSRNVDGVEVDYDSYDDSDDHEDEEIDESLLLAPQDELLVDRHDRPIIMPYSDTE
ncbi:hypothetical protein A2U01_0050978 [Trifolium medium]|uniref:Uncharacterized protein n=1 Tax=Trifolium medium TaxID=97028 RepID=A0A392R0J6_9FABA|nr:hypothetical protein [Trifolium medium]